MRAYVKDGLKSRIKRKIVILIMLLICSMVILLQPVSAATPAIKYDGKEATISFENIIETDFFQNFKGVMPGDTRSQDIVLKSKSLERDASFYIQAECDDKTKELLKDVKLNIDADGKKITENGIIFEAVKLGTIRENGSLPVKVTMNFPLTIGNEVIGQELHVKWNIIVQEDGKEVAQEVIPSGKPQTGDKSSILTWLVIVLISGLALMIVIRKIKKGIYNLQ